MALALSSLATWPARRFGLALGAALLVAAVTGVPTDLIDTPLFGREIGVTAWAYPVWIVSSLLAGLLAATALRPGRPVAGGGLLALFAVGCPVCNKPVLILLGTSGALEWFAPIQPVLGAFAVVALAGALIVRLRAEAACNVATGRGAAGV